MIKKKFDFSEVGLCDKFTVGFYSVATKDTSCSIRIVPKFEPPARASNKTRLNPIRTWLFESVEVWGFPPALVKFDPDSLGQ